MNQTEELDRAGKAISGTPRAVLVCHLGPDGDAIGSMLGLAWLMRKHGIEVSCSYGEPFGLPANYRFLPLDLMVPPTEIPEEPDLMISLDAASADRLGSLLPMAHRAKSLIVIDHHISNPGFGHINVIDPGAAATAEIVFRLIRLMGWELDATSATCLLTGIVTDTGRFQYSSTTPETLRVAAELLTAGARPEVIGRHMYEEAPFGYLKAAGRVLSRAVLDKKHQLVWSVLTLEDLREAGISVEETELLIDILRIARESEVALLVKESPDGKVKGSMRSRGEIDVSEIAGALGGGGHHNAAGVTFEGKVEDLVAEITRRLPSVDVEET